MNFMSIILTQTGMRFSCEHNLPEMKWISADSLDVAFKCACAFVSHCGYGFHIGQFERNEISFRVIKYHVNSTRNEMHTHVYQVIGLFWNSAETKLHVNITFFHTGLKSQTGMSSFHVSCTTLQSPCSYYVIPVQVLSKETVIINVPASNAREETTWTFGISYLKQLYQKFHSSIFHIVGNSYIYQAGIWL